MTPAARVLLVHNRYQQRGGEDAVVEAEAALLEGAGHAVELYLRNNDDIAHQPGLGTALDAIWSRRAAADLGQLIERFKPDVMHAHNTFPLISPSIFWAARRRRVASVLTLHNFRLICPQAMFLRHGRTCEDCLGRSPWRALPRRCYRGSTAQTAVLTTMLQLHRTLGTYQTRIDRFIALSQFSRAKLIAGGLPGDKIVVKPNFVDCADPAPDATRAGGLYVGRLAVEKGIAVLAEAYSGLTDIPLTVIGDGPEAGNLAQIRQIRRLGQLAGADVKAAMHRAAYLVLPSISYENFPLVIAEAYACGLPVIASDFGAMAELVTPQVTGLTFKAGSAVDLRAAVLWAEAHPERMAQMGREARRRYAALYTPERNLALLLDIYRQARAASAGETGR
jgi:glycosyltransferase involved in cell wall biosynthesis